jgi:hypothetical protein
MKRSEILKVMQDAVNQYHLLYSGNPDGYSCNDHILKKLEKAGMLPPPLRTDAVTSSIVYCYYPEVEEIEKDGTLDIAKSKLWEDE